MKGRFHDISVDVLQQKVAIIKLPLANTMLVTLGQAVNVWDFIFNILMY